MLTSKALRPLPDKHHGLTDPELRIRQRYVDLVVNPDSRRMVHDRAAVVRAVRDVLHGHGFVEVETPVLQMVHGGAAARPFATHLNALDLDMTLRIALELYLKRLVVGGVDRVFEIGRIFRNEGVDSTHSPEFTMLEFYEAYGDYDTVAEKTREMVLEAARRTGRTVVPDGQGGEIDLEQPWRSATLHGLVSEAVGEQVDAGTPLEQRRRARRRSTTSRCRRAGTPARSCSSSTRSSSSTRCCSRRSSRTTRSAPGRWPATTATTRGSPRPGTSSSPAPSWRPGTPSWSTRSSSAGG